MTRPRLLLTAALAAILTVTTACNAPGQEGNFEPDAPDEAPVQAPVEEGPAILPPAEQSVSGTVPDVVGVNHQLAQDTMQASGFYNLSEEDATGAGRMLINDRNWVVVSQTPKGGTKAAEDTTIVLRSKKVGE